jgi:hypothetical protein
MPLPGRHPRQVSQAQRRSAAVRRRNPGTPGPSFRIRAPQPGNFRPNVKLDTSHIHDLRVSSGTSAQLQGRRAAAKRKFTAR